MADRFTRRLVTIPFVVCCFFLSAALFPALLLLALLVDLVRAPRQLTTTRLITFALCFLAVEVFGLVLLFFTFLTTRANTRPRLARTFAIQRLYTAAHLASVTRLFSLRFIIEGEDQVAPGPLLIFVRHASIIDTLVPGGFIANVHHLELRYVLKKELLVEPCLDIAGHWLPNRFVARGGENTAAELQALRALKAGIGAHEGVLIYPEGTRFSRGKRQALIDKLEGDAKERARRLRHLLPVRRGGVLSLLDASPHCDVLFVAHHGLEGFGRIADIWRGKLVGQTVRVRFTRVKADAVPTTDDARLSWMNDQWQRIDDWLEGLGE